MNIEINFEIPQPQTYNKAELSWIRNNSAGVYCLYEDGKDDPIYVGKSSSLKSRIRAHFEGKTNTKTFSSRFDRVVIYNVTDPHIRDILEIYFINKYKPEGNNEYKYIDKPDTEEDVLFRLMRSRTGNVVIANAEPPAEYTPTENKLWRVSRDTLMAYTEDEAVMKKIRRTYLGDKYGFEIYMEYCLPGNRRGIQYKIPSNRKRIIRRLLNVCVSSS